MSSPGGGRQPSASEQPPTVTEADRANAEIAASEYNRYITKFLPLAKPLAASFRDPTLARVAARGVVDRDAAIDTRGFDRAAALSSPGAAGRRTLGSPTQSTARRGKAGLGQAVTLPEKRRLEGLSNLIAVGEGLSGSAMQSSRTLAELANNSARLNTELAMNKFEGDFNTRQSIASSLASGLGAWSARKLHNRPVPPPVDTPNYTRAQANAVPGFRGVGR